MKKLILILFSIFFLTGCDVDYNLNIDSKYMTESIDFVLENNQDNLNRVNNFNKNKLASYFDMDLNKSHYYDSNLDIGNNINLNYTYKYTGENLKKSQFINYCFYKFNVIKNDTYIIIETNDGISCKYKDGIEQFDKLNINIKTKLKVEDNNADKSFNGKYTWVIDDNNYSNKNIYIKINHTPKANGISPTVAILIGVSVVLLIGLVIFIFVNNSSKKNNKI